MTRKNVMVWMKDLWLGLSAAEPEAPHNPEVKALLQAMLWPQSTLCREILVAAYECNFEDLPADVVAELQKATLGFGMSVICENGHSKIVDCQRQSKAKNLGRMAKYHRVLTSGLLKENDRDMPRSSQEDKVAMIPIS